MEHENNISSVVVVSAPGKDEQFPVKATDMLLEINQEKFTITDVQERYGTILEHTGMDSDQDSLSVIAKIPADFEEWQRKGDPVEALGEYWSAKLFAVQTGRTFVDAREVIIFCEDGKLNEAASFKAIRQKLGDGGKYVVPGYYGSKGDKVHVFDRGGSDTTGAIIARALNADRYDNWSDVDGFMTADPKKVPDGARLLSSITYQEHAELYWGGNGLLHGSVSRFLADRRTPAKHAAPEYLTGSGIKTVMRNTFGKLGNSGTVIEDSRNWRDEPIVGIASRDDLIALTSHSPGSVGRDDTFQIINTLKAANVPHLRSNDTTVCVDAEFGTTAAMEVVEKLLRPGQSQKLSMETSGVVHVVGEGLRQHGITRIKSLGAVATALGENGIQVEGIRGLAGDDVALSFFVNPEAVSLATKVAHTALNLSRL